MSTAKAMKTPATEVNRKSVKPLTFNNPIHKTLKQIKPNNNITQAACTQLDAFMKIFSRQLASKAISISHNADRRTVSVPDVKTAVQLVLPGTLADRALEEGERAVNHFKNSKEAVKKNKAARSQLQFPPHLSEKFLRVQNSANQGAASKLSVAQYAPIFMAAVTEYITAEILELAGDAATDMNRQTINVRHLALATKNDPALNNLMTMLNVDWIGGGTTPFIHEALLPNKEKERSLASKRRKAREGEEKTPGGRVRKALPGRKALRDIRKYQKSFGLLQRKEHFKRFVRDLADPLWDDGEENYYGAGVMNNLQLFAEAKATEVLRAAINVMVHAGRETLEASDVELAWSLMKPARPDVAEESACGHLANPGVRRLASRAGAKRVSIDTYNEVCKVMAYYVAQLLQSSFLLMEHNKVRTLTVPLLRQGAELVGINLPVGQPRRKPKKVKTADTVEDYEESEVEDFSSEEDEEESE